MWSAVMEYSLLTVVINNSIDFAVVSRISRPDRTHYQVS